MSPLPFLVGGEFVSGADRPLVSVNPADGSRLAELSTAGPEDVAAAVAAARRALAAPDWRDLLPHERARYLSRMADLVDRDADALAVVQMRDNGKTLAECRGQARAAAGVFRYYAALCETLETEVTPPRGPWLSLTLREPVGVVAAITPWNSPLTMEAQKIAPALAAGNAVVLKPSEVAPLTALEFARIAVEAGLPPGALNVVTGRGEVAGQALVDHPDIDMVAFTGGTATGRAIARAVADRLLPALLELGGKSPHIVFADADADRALAAVADGIFAGAGQSCIAGSRVLVERPVFDDFVGRFVERARALRPGLPDDAATGIGPLASFDHRDRVEAAIALAREEGARVLCGGERPAGPPFDDGAFLAPTILAGLGHDSRTAREEIFGPVACVFPFDDEAELVALADATGYGLACGIWSADFARAWRVARAVRAGTVWLNTYRRLSISTPFGGEGQSGLGREKGIEGFRSYTRLKAVYHGLEG